MMDLYDYNKGCTGSIGCIIMLAVMIAGCALVWKCATHDEDEYKSLFEKCQMACEKQDFQEAHNFLIKIKALDYSEDKTEEAEDYVFRNESLYLVSMNDNMANKRLMYLFSEINRPVEPMPEGVYDKEVHQYSDGDVRYSVPEKVTRYQSAAMRYNRKCDAILEIAERQGNKVIVDYVLSLYVRNAVITDIIKQKAVKTRGPVTRTKKRSLLGKLVTGEDEKFETVIDDKYDYVDYSPSFKLIYKKHIDIDSLNFKQKELVQ